MKVSFYDIMCIAPISGLKTNIHRKTMTLIIKNENELRTYDCKEGFLSVVIKTQPDINKTDLYEDYCYISKLLRAIKYNFLTYHQYLKTKHLYPILKLPHTEIDIDYIALYERHKSILKPDDPHIRKRTADFTVNLNIDTIIDDAMFSMCKNEMPNLSDKEIIELIEQVKKERK